MAVISICVKTEDCKTRKNWITIGNTVKVGAKYVSNNRALSPNGIPMDKSLLPVQDVDTNLGVNNVRQLQLNHPNV